ncbi:MAG: MoaD/ThiS family protein [Planctomycetaceae bacterium]|nr:MoaD/ThiS family protein [Planctomycetaceae bacterium]
MISVTILLEAQLRIQAGQSEVCLEISEVQPNLASAIKLLQERYPALKLRNVLAFRNNQPVGSSGDATELAHGDTLLLMPPISGG